MASSLGGAPPVEIDVYLLPCIFFLKHFKLCLDLSMLKEMQSIQNDSSCVLIAFPLSLLDLQPFLHVAYS